MSFLADKKREHESAIESALAEKDYVKALFHTSKAAEFGLKLAEQSEGPVAEQHVEDAYDLLDIAERLKVKARTQDRKSARSMVKADGVEEPSHGKSWELQEKPEVRLDDVAGLDEMKAVLRQDVISHFEHPEAYERFRAKGGGGVLMYGPPGNGKTYIAKAIAGELDAAFFNVDISQVKSKYVGDTAKNLAAIFEEAQKRDRAVIFLDEVHALLGKKGGRKVDAVEQFLVMMDGIKAVKNCLLVLGATNYPWLIDAPVLRQGRLGIHVYVGLPDAAARAGIVTLNLKGVPANDDVSAADIAAKTEGYSGADVAAVCDRAKKLAIQRQIDSGQDEVLTAADFSDALEKVKPTVSQANLRDYERWRDTKTGPGGADEDD